MALDEILDSIAAEVTHIGLLTSADPGDEVTGNGYARQVPTYGAASDGSVDITATLEFSGPPSTEVTHLLYVRGSDEPIVRPVTAPKQINGDGRIDVTSAELTLAYAD